MLDRPVKPSQVTGAQGASRGAFVTCCVLAAVLAVTGPAAAAATVGVGLGSPGGDLTVGGTASVPVTVSNASGGVGSFELTVESADAGVVRVENVTVAGDPTLVTRESGGSGRNVSVAVLGLNHSESNLTVATVEIAGVAEGTTTLELSVTSVGDADGASYDAQVTSGSRQVTVGAASDLPPVVGQFDGNGDGSISITELGSAASAYVTGGIGIAELGDVAAAYVSS